jgi:ABC-2 type transport system permease protein
MTTWLSKAITLTGVVAVGGTIAVLGSMLAGRLILPDLGDQVLSLADGPTLRAVFGTVLYLILMGLLSLGVAAAVRDSATSVGVVLGLLYIVPIVSQTISDPDWQRLLEKMAPMSAGLAIQATTDLGSLPISPWAGLGVTAGWAAAALVAGGLPLCIRDA